MDNLITVTGIGHYFGKRPFKVGSIVRLVKEQENDYDADAIHVELPYIGIIGYVANSPDTVFDGTSSAGRIYDKIATVSYARVEVITHSSVIAQRVTDEEAVASGFPVNLAPEESGNDASTGSLK